MSARQHPVGLKNPVITDSFPAETTPGLALCLVWGSTGSSALPRPHIGCPCPFSSLLPSLTALDSWRGRCWTPGDSARLPVARVGQAVTGAPTLLLVPPVPRVGPSPVAVPVQQPPCGWQQTRTMWVRLQPSECPLSPQPFCRAAEVRVKAQHAVQARRRWGDARGRDPGAPVVKPACLPVPRALFSSCPQAGTIHI